MRAPNGASDGWDIYECTREDNGYAYVWCNVRTSGAFNFNDYDKLQ